MSCDKTGFRMCTAAYEVTAVASWLQLPVTVNTAVTRTTALQHTRNRYFCGFLQISGS
jgi:hypothetical protein